MPNYYITAIRMGSGTKEEHVTRCLCLNPATGKTMEWFPKTIAGRIDAGRRFHVGSSDGPVDVVAVHRKDDDDYVRTAADGKRTNNLLELPRF